jgi:hypothetical protein
MDPKALLRSALQKAHVAVLADQEKNNMVAMEVYTEALMLLDQVLIAVDRDEDRMRIQQIVSNSSCLKENSIRLHVFLNHININLGSPSMTLIQIEYAVCIFCRQNQIPQTCTIHSVTPLNQRQQQQLKQWKNKRLWIGYQDLPIENILIGLYVVQIHPLHIIVLPRLLMTGSSLQGRQLDRVPITMLTMVWNHPRLHIQEAHPTLGIL